MVKTGIIFLVVFIFITLGILSCSQSDSLDSQLDRLEKIIIKYEPKFDTIEYGSKEYSDMVTEYNTEIFAWAEKFEKDRYEKGPDGNPVPKKEFEQVSKRFYDLNNRMTRMVLAKIPKPETPVKSDRYTDPVTEEPPK